MAKRAATLWDVLLPAGIVLITAAVYAHTLGFGFVHDDWAQIAGTGQIASWHNIPSFFNGHVWSPKSPGSAGYYRPIFQLWMLINFKLFGAAAWGWRLMSILVHLVATLLVYHLALRIAKNRMIAALTVALFGLHPAHIEAIDWPSAISGPLATVFLLAAFLCYLKAKAKGAKKKAWLLLALLFYALGAFENEIGVLLPALIFLYEWIFGDHGDSFQWRFGGSLGRCFPFLGIAAVYLAARVHVIHGLSVVISPVARSYALMTWPSMLVFYFKHLVWPFPLSLFYVVPVLTRPTLMEFWIPLEIVLAAGVAIFLSADWSKEIVFGGVWVLLTLMPVLNIRAFAHNEAVHDRYLYLPSIGFCLIVAVLLHEAFAVMAASRSTINRAAVVALLLGLMAFGTIQQSGQWSDNYSLFQHALEISPNNETANQGMGTELFLRHSYAQSAQYYRRALDLQLSLPDAAYGLARCYLELGIARTKQGQLQEAEALIRDAIRRKGPDDFSNYHASLAEVLKLKGDLPGALSEFRMELRENPSSQIAQREIAMLEAQRSR